MMYGKCIKDRPLLMKTVFHKCANKELQQLRLVYLTHLHSRLRHSASQVIKMICEQFSFLFGCSTLKTWVKLMLTRAKWKLKSTSNSLCFVNWSPGVDESPLQLYGSQRPVKLSITSDFLGKVYSEAEEPSPTLLLLFKWHHSYLHCTKLAVNFTVTSWYL